jgi:ferritin-like metal-binding protein YciE
VTLQDLLVEELQDLYDAEHQLHQALEAMSAAAGGDALRAALASHREETHTHIARLDEAFSLLGVRAAGRHSAGIAAIIATGSALLAETEIDSALRDARLIASAQKAEHYEMCGYGTCVAWARTLGLDAVAGRLEQTLEEEKAADQALTDLAEQEVNISATHEAV